MSDKGFIGIAALLLIFGLAPVSPHASVAVLVLVVLYFVFAFIAGGVEAMVRKARGTK